MSRSSLPFSARVRALPLLSLLLPLAAASHPEAAYRGVEWRSGPLADTVAVATERQKPVLIYCWADGSERCGELWTRTLAKDDAQGHLDSFVCYNAKHGQPGVHEMFQKFGVTVLPTLLFLSPEGEAEDLIQGFIPVDKLGDELNRIRRGEQTVSGLHRDIEKAGDDVEAGVDARYALAGKVQALGNQEAHDLLLDEIRALDRKGATETGALLLLTDLIQGIVGDGGPDNAKDFELAPLHEFLNRIEHESVQFSGWQWLGRTYMAREQMSDSLESWEQAWKSCPENQQARWGSAVARWVVFNPEGRTSKEYGFALKLAKSSVELSRKGIIDLEAEKASQHDLQGAKEQLCQRLLTCARVHAAARKHAPAKRFARQAHEMVESDELRAEIEQFQATLK